MSKLLEFSLKFGLFLALITGTSSIFYNKKKQQFLTSKFHIGINYVMTVIVIVGSFYVYITERDYKDTDDLFLKATKSVYQVTKYLIVILMYSKPWICRQKLLDIINNSFKLHEKCGGKIEKYKTDLLILLYLGEFMKVILYLILAIFLNEYKLDDFAFRTFFYIFVGVMRYILNIYFIIIVWHKQLLMTVARRIKYLVDNFMVYSLNYNVNTNKSKHMIECTKLCDEFDECYEVFNDIIVSIKSIHQFMLPILVPEAVVLVIDCLATVCSLSIVFRIQLII